MLLSQDVRGLDAILDCGRVSRSYCLVEAALEVTKGSQGGSLGQELLCEDIISVWSFEVQSRR